MAIDYSNLEMAFEFVSFGYEGEHTAYLDRLSGEVHYDSDESEDVMPDDLFTNDKYVEIPSTKEFGLGKPLAIEFTRNHLSSDLNRVYTLFSSSRAYSNFKALLEKRGVLQTWYTFEQAALKNAILEWCNDNEISI
jgi:hypothetical protein